MIKTYYTCERCNAVQETPAQFWEVCLFVNEMTRHRSEYTIYQAQHKIQLCRVCVEEWRLTPRACDDKTPLPTPSITLEQMIREMVRDEKEAS